MWTTFISRGILGGILVMEKDLLQWLAKWASRKAKGEWEHCFSVNIPTIENPGLVSR